MTTAMATTNDDYDDDHEEDGDDDNDPDRFAYDDADDGNVMVALKGCVQRHARVPSTLLLGQVEAEVAWSAHCEQSLKEDIIESLRKQEENSRKAIKEAQTSHKVYTHMCGRPSGRRHNSTPGHSC